MGSAFFSASETAILSVSRIRIRTLSESGDKRADNVLRLIDDKDRIISVILIGNNIVNISSSAIATSIAMTIYGDIGVAIATAVTTVVILIFGEIVPKTISSAISETVALNIARILLILSKILSPVVWFTSKITYVVSMIIGIDKDATKYTVSEDELYTIIDVSHEEGVIEGNEKKMLKNVFRFMDILVKKLMVTNIDILAIDINS